MAGISITWTATSANYDISAQGFDDWALWNSGSGSGTSVAPSQRKSGGGSTIGNMARVGSGNIAGFSGSLATASWTGGTPTASGSNNNAVFNDLNASGGTTTGSGASTTLPADTTQREAKYYFASFNGAITLTCTLGDGSAGPTSNTSLSDPGVTGTAGFYTITYSANSSTTLTVSAVVTTANGAFADVEPQGIGYKALSADVTVNLTGNASTAGLGSVASASDLAVSGNAGTSGLGTVASASSLDLSGNAGTGAVGTVVPSLDIALTGVEGTGSVGDVTYSGSGTDVNVSLSGVQSDSGVGSVAASLDTGLTGVFGSGAVGDLAGALSVGLAGNESTTAVGDLTAQATGDVTVSLSGVEAAGQTGSLTPSGGSTTGGIDTWGSVYIRKKKKPEVTVAGPTGPTLRETIESAMTAKEKAPVVHIQPEQDEDEEEVLMLLL